MAATCCGAKQRMRCIRSGARLCPERRRISVIRSARNGKRGSSAKAPPTEPVTSSGPPMGVDGDVIARGTDTAVPPSMPDHQLPTVATAKSIMCTSSKHHVADLPEALTSSSKHLSTTSTLPEAISSSFLPSTSTTSTLPSMDPSAASSGDKNNAGDVSMRGVGSQTEGTAVPQGSEAGSSEVADDSNGASVQPADLNFLEASGPTAAQQQPRNHDLPEASKQKASQLMLSDPIRPVKSVHRPVRTVQGPPPEATLNISKPTSGALGPPSMPAGPRKSLQHMVSGPTPAGREWVHSHGRAAAMVSQASGLLFIAIGAASWGGWFWWQWQQQQNQLKAAAAKGSPSSSAAAAPSQPGSSRSIATTSSSATTTSTASTSAVALESSEQGAADNPFAEDEMKDPWAPLRVLFGRGTSTAAETAPTAGVATTEAPASSSTPEAASAADTSTSSPSSPSSSPATPPPQLLPDDWWTSLSRVHYINFGAGLGLVPRLRLSAERLRLCKAARAGGPAPDSASWLESSNANSLVAFEDAADAEFMASTIKANMFEAHPDQLLSRRPLKHTVQSGSPVFLEDLARMQGMELRVVPCDRLPLAQRLRDPEMYITLYEILTHGAIISDLCQQPASSPITTVDVDPEQEPVVPQLEGGTVDTVSSTTGSQNSATSSGGDTGGRNGSPDQGTAASSSSSSSKFFDFAGFESRTSKRQLTAEQEQRRQRREQRQQRQQQQQQELSLRQEQEQWQQKQQEQQEQQRQQQELPLRQEQQQQQQQEQQEKELYVRHEQQRQQGKEEEEKQQKAQQEQQQQEQQELFVRQEQQRQRQQQQQEQQAQQRQKQKQQELSLTPEQKQQKQQEQQEHQEKILSLRQEQQRQRWQQELEQQEQQQRQEQELSLRQEQQQQQQQLQQQEQQEQQEQQLLMGSSTSTSSPPSPPPDAGGQALSTAGRAQPEVTQAQSDVDQSDTDQALSVSDVDQTRPDVLTPVVMETSSGADASLAASLDAMSATGQGQPDVDQTHSNVVVPVVLEASRHVDSGMDSSLEATSVTSSVLLPEAADLVDPIVIGGSAGIQAGSRANTWAVGSSMAAAGESTSGVARPRPSPPRLYGQGVEELSAIESELFREGPTDAAIIKAMGMFAPPELKPYEMDRDELLSEWYGLMKEPQDEAEDLWKSKLPGNETGSGSADASAANGKPSSDRDSAASQQAGNSSSSNGSSSNNISSSSSNSNKNSSSSSSSNGSDSNKGGTNGSASGRSGSSTSSTSRSNASNSNGGNSGRSSSSSSSAPNSVASTAQQGRTQAGAQGSAQSHAVGGNGNGNVSSSGASGGSGRSADVSGSRSGNGSSDGVVGAGNGKGSSSGAGLGGSGSSAAVSGSASSSNTSTGVSGSGKPPPAEEDEYVKVVMSNLAGLQGKLDTIKRQVDSVTSKPGVRGTPAAATAKASAEAQLRPLQQEVERLQGLLQMSENEHERQRTSTIDVQDSSSPSTTNSKGPATASSSTPSASLPMPAAITGGSSGRSWGAWGKNPRIQGSGASLIKGAGANADRSPPRTAPVEVQQTVAQIAMPAKANRRPNQQPVVNRKEDDGTTIVNRRVGTNKPKRREVSPEEKQAAVTRALRMASAELSATDGDDQEDEDGGGDGGPSSSSSGTKPWWQARFQALWLPNLVYADGALGFVQVDVSIRENKRDMRVLAFEDRHDASHCMAVMKQWPEYDWCEMSITFVPTADLESRLLSVHSEQVELNQSVHAPAGVVVFRKGKLPMRVGMELADFTNIIVAQAVAQKSLSKIGFDVNDL